MDKVYTLLLAIQHHQTSQCLNQPPAIPVGPFTLSTKKATDKPAALGPERVLLINTDVDGLLAGYIRRFTPLDQPTD